MEEKKSLEKQLHESATEQLSDDELETVSGGLPYFYIPPKK